MTNYFPLVGDIKFDFIRLTYDGSGNLVLVEYLINGVGGDVVETLTLTYDGSGNLLTVTKTTP